MFPFPPDPLHPFDKPLLNHHPFPPPKLDAASPLFPLSPSIFDHELLNDLSLLAPPPQISPPSPPHPAPFRPDGPSTTHKSTVAAPSTKAFCGLNKGAAATATKSLTGGRRLRKDRHSKIYTAQGPRDRRMRLSLGVARKFFDLQDVLGFDKASKTVDWLLTCCKASIMELTGSSSPPPHPASGSGGNGARSESSTSECEVVSISANTTPAGAREKRGAARRPRKVPALHPAPSRESRLMARARARERTREKKMQRGGFEERDQKKKPAFEATGEESGTHTVKSSLEMVAEEGKPRSSSPDQYYKKGSGSASPPWVQVAGWSDPISILDYSQNIVHNGEDAIGFVQEHWGMQPSGNVEEQRVLFADAQLQPWLWEPFNPCL